MTTKAHAPTPWKYEDNGFDGVIKDAEGNFICGGEPSEGRLENDENTDFILRACNSHEELLAALKELDSYVHTRYGNHGPINMWTMVREAITKAEAK